MSNKSTNNITTGSLTIGTSLLGHTHTYDHYKMIEKMVLGDKDA